MRRYWDIYVSAQFLKFLGVGGTAALLHWLSRIALSRFFSFSAAIVIAYGVGMLTAFLLNKRYVFPQADRPVGYQIRWFLTINLLSLPLVWASAILLARNLLPWCGVTAHVEAVAHGMAICLPVFANFVAHKFITFNRARFASAPAR